MARRYRTEYSIGKWGSPEELVALMQQKDDEGWRTDLTRLYKNGDDGGWTIFVRSYEVNPSMLDATYTGSEIYGILNSTEVHKAAFRPSEDGQTVPVVQEFARQLKAIYDRRYPEALLKQYE